MTAAASLESIRADLGAAVAEAAERLWGAQLERVVLERPPSLTLGDLASPAAFDLAKNGDHEFRADALHALE